jgi:hypothetical protein
MWLAKRHWKLSSSQRLLILLCAGLYLCLFRPWAQEHAASASSVYAGASAMLVAALLPAKLHLVSALAVALLAAVLVLVAFGAVAPPA